VGANAQKWLGKDTTATKAGATIRYGLNLLGTRVAAAPPALQVTDAPLLISSTADTSEVLSPRSACNFVEQLCMLLAAELCYCCNCNALPTYHALNAAPRADNP
jgi:hypothetical protein